MSATPSETGPGGRPPDDYDEALGDAIQHDSAREKALGERQEGRGLSAGAQWTIVGVLAVLAAWLWLLPPAALQPPPPARFTPELEETSVRMDMFVQASRILNYQEENGRLPATAEEAGDPVEGVTYELLDGGRFRLLGGSAGFAHTWDSDDPPDSLLGSAPDIVREGAANASN